MQSHGAFMQQSAGHDMFAKLWQGQNRGMMPPGLHIMVLPIMFFPYALYVVFAAPDVWKNRSDMAIKFCLGWIIPTWIVFELSLTKLPHYVLPAYPAIALLAAKFLLDGFPTMAASQRRLPIMLINGMWLSIGAGFAFIFSVLPAFSDQAWDIPQMVAGCVLFFAQGMALLLLPKGKTASLVALTLGGLIFMSVTFGYTVPSLHHVWMSREIVEAAEPIKPCAQSQIVSVGYHEPSLAFMAGTDTIMLTNALDAAAALKQDPCRIAIIDNKHKQEFLDAFAKDKQIPLEPGSIAGLNSGHGATTVLTLFILPQGAP
jgi:4-amino-4-deoxy-L-arabinose transferase-like glycosyltransferase